MENKIINQVSSVQINNVEYPKNTLMIDIDNSTGNVFIKTVAEQKTVASGLYSTWRNLMNIPYNSLSALVTDLRSLLFKG